MNVDGRGRVNWWQQRRRTNADDAKEEQRKKKAVGEMWKEMDVGFLDFSVIFRVEHFYPKLGANQSTLHHTSLLKLLSLLIGSVDQVNGVKFNVGGSIFQTLGTSGCNFS